MTKIQDMVEEVVEDTMVQADDVKIVTPRDPKWV